MYKIFAINPGSTSTKLAVFNDSKLEYSRTMEHNPEDLKSFQVAVDQFEFRFELIKHIMKEENIELNKIDAFVGRGGFLKPLAGGTYLVGESMLEDLRESKYGNHASNLGAMIAARFGAFYGKAAYIVDPPVVDEFMEDARFTGLPGISRKSVFHALNQKASAIFAAKEAGMDYNKGRFIVAHLGGGISVGVHELGRVVDVNNALWEGPFTPERAGALPTEDLVDLCFSGEYTKSEIKKLLVGKGGLMAYTGTTDFRKLEKMVEKDVEIKKIMNAFIYRISREICGCAAALNGKIDRIVLTGGLAKSKLLVEGIKNRISFLGTVSVIPGEREMIALAEGVLRVLEGSEEAKEYRKG